MAFLEATLGMSTEDTTSLRDVFIAELKEPLQEAWAQTDGLEQHLATCVQQAQRTWPTLALATEEFVRYLAARAPSEPGLAALEAMHSSDLFLACACCSGQSNALRAFDEHCAQEWERGTGRFSLQPSQAAEVRQALRTRLFVANEPGGEHIRRYSGKGAIAAWYRTTAVRATIDALRSSNREPQAQRLDDLDDHVALVDLELDYLKRNYRQEFKESFHAALRSLATEDRNLLRYQVIENLTLEEIGRLYNLHLTSIARRLSKVRLKLLESTREQLQSRLGVDDVELDSIMRLIGSRLDVSIEAVLAHAS